MGTHKTRSLGSFKPRVELHDNVPADLLSRWQKVRQFRATQPRCTDDPDFATISAAQTHLLGRVAVLILSATVAPVGTQAGATLAEGRSLKYNQNCHYHKRWVARQKLSPNPFQCWLDYKIYFNFFK